MKWIYNATVTSVEPFAKTTKILFSHDAGAGKAMVRNDDSFAPLLHQGAVLNMQLESRVSKFTGKNGEQISDDWVVSVSVPSSNHGGSPQPAPTTSRPVGADSREATIIAQCLIKALYSRNNGSSPTLHDVDHIVSLYHRALSQLSAGENR